ncbi:MAG TPA: alpha-L-fucosidase [Bacteroidales bacterium]|nr:alpha-L-fucosidase [Bacteroidales bacterium]
MKKGLLIALLMMVFLPTIFSQELSQDQRMKWWRDGRFGLFIHWGLYSIPAGEWNGNEIPGIGEWIMKNAQIPASDYRELAKKFNPVKFDAKAFVKVAKEAGMTYIAITSKHHDGFAMFKSNASKYNMVDATPYGKDVVKALAEECQKQGIKMCFYYSQSRDWNEPNGLDNEWDFPKERDFQKYLDEKVKPQLTELLTQYGPVGMIWFDTPMTITKDQAQQLKDLVRKLQPATIISGRLGGGVETDYSSTGDNAIPSMALDKDWEVPATLNNTWGFKKNDHEWKSPETTTRLLFDIASKGGNYLLNVGPTSEGIIPEESVNILKTVGDWMKVNSDAIYGTKGTPFVAEFPWGNITQKQNKLYLGIYEWPTSDFYLDGLCNKINKIYLLSDPAKKPLGFKQTYNKQLDHHRVRISLPKTAPDKIVSVVVMELDGQPQVEKIISQQLDGKVYLQGPKAVILKGQEKYDLNFITRGGGANGYNDPRITLSWDFKIEKPGTYRVDIITSETGSHGSPQWEGNHQIKILCNGQTFDTKIVADSKEFNQRNQYWKNIRTNGKEVRFDKPGTYHLQLIPQDIKKENVGFTFREINLIPIK